MHAHSIRLGNRLHPRFTHGRVRVYSVDTLMARGFQVAGDYHLGDQLGDVCTELVATPPLAILGIKNHLHKALFVTQTGRLSTRGERKLANHHIVPLLFGLLLRQPDRSNLWLTVGGTGDVVVVDRRGLTRQPFNAGDPLVSCLVRQPGGSRHITDRIDVLCSRLVGGPVDLDGASVVLHTGLVQTQILNITHHTDSREYQIRLNLFATFRSLDGHLHTLALLLHLLYRALGVDGEPFLLVDLAELLADILIFNRYQCLLKLYNGDLCAEGVVEVGRLNTDSTCTDHDHLLRLLVELDRLLIANHGLSVDRNIGKLPRSGSCGDDEVLRLDRLCLLAILILDRQLLVRREHTCSHQNLNLVGSHQELDSLAHLVSHTPAALDNSRRDQKSPLLNSTHMDNSYAVRSLMKQ